MTVETIKSPHDSEAMGDLTEMPSKEGKPKTVWTVILDNNFWILRKFCIYNHSLS